MKNKRVILLVAVATLFSIVSCGGTNNGGVTSENISEPSYDPIMKGEGTEDSPYLIENKGQLKTFQESSKSAYYKLTADIDFRGEEWNPVGDIDEDKQFTGTFDGNGHKISNVKITKYDANHKYYGFFGYTTKAHIKNVTFDALTIDITVSGTDSLAVIGGVVALGRNTSVSNVRVNYAKFNVASTQTGEGSIYAGGIGGYMASVSDENGMYFVQLSESSVKGDIIVDETKSGADVVSIVGGAVGICYTGSGDGIYAITNTYVGGNVTGGTYTGGITGYLDVYCSVSDSIISGKKVEATRASGCYAGGISAFASAETAIMNCAVDLDEIKAQKSATQYASFAGHAAGYYKTLQGSIENYGIYEQGCEIYNTYAKAGIKAESNYIDEVDTQNLTKNFYSTKLKLSEKAWDLSTDTPKLKDNIDLGKVNVTLDINNDKDPLQTVEIDGGKYSSELATKAIDAEYYKKGFTFNGFTYDLYGKHTYRWYVPVNRDITLFAKWENISEIAGTYMYTLTYGQYSHSGYWKFDDKNFIWINDEGSVMKYTYMYDATNSVIYIKSYVGLEESPGKVYGGYINSVFTIKADGSITTLDANDNETVYTATKQANDVYVPDYTDSKAVGTWFASNGTKFTLNKDGNCFAINKTSEVTFYGGYRFENNTLDISISGRIIARGENAMTYDEVNDVFVSDDLFACKEDIVDKFTSNDGLTIYTTATKTYVIKYGECVTTTVDGSLQDGETVVIGENSYTVSNKTLTKVVVTPPVVEDKDDEDDKPVVDTKTYLGTWTISVGTNKGIEVTFNADGTMVYNKMNGVYTVSGNKITFNVNNLLDFQLTYDSENQTLKGIMEDDDYNEISVTSTSYVAPKVEDDEPVSNLPGYCGTYTVKGAFNQTATMKINSDGTATYGEATGTYTVTGNTIKVVLNNTYEFTLTYNEETKKLTGTWEDDDYNEYQFEYTAFVAETPAKEDEETVANTYIGTWTGTSGSNSIVIEIAADGSFKYGSVAGTYVESNNKIVATLTTGDTVELTYDAEKQVVKGTWSDEFDEYSFAINCSSYAPFAKGDDDVVSDDPAVGKYTGTWGYYSQTTCIIELKADGTGTLSNSSTVCIEFKYSIQADGKMTLTNVVYVNSAFDDLELKYDAEKGKITGKAVEDFEYDYTISVTK